MIYKNTKIIIIAVIAALIGVIYSNEACATARETLLNVAVANGIYECYMGGHVDDSFKSKSVREIDDFIDDNAEDFVLLPTDYTGIDDDDLSCAQLVGGYDKWGNNWPALATVPKDNAQKESFFISLGYDKGEAEVEGGMCVVYYYLAENTYYLPFVPTDKTTYASSTHYLCSEKIKNGKIVGQNSAGQDIIDGKINVDKLTLDTSVGSENFVEFENSSGYTQLDCSTSFFIGWIEGYGGCEKHSFEEGETMWSDFIVGIARDMADHATPQTSSTCISYTDYGDCMSYMTTTLTFGTDQRQERIYDQITTDDLTRKYYLKPPFSAAMKATETLTGISTYKSLGITKAQRFFLYQDYLRSVYDAQVVCNPQGDAVEIAAITGGHEQVYLYDVETGQFSDNCWAKATKNADKKVNGVKDVEYVQVAAGPYTADKTAIYRFAQKRSFSELIAALNDSKDITDLGDEYKSELSAFTKPGADDPGDPGETPHEPSCYDSAGSLGWVLCPIINKGQQTVEWLYGLIEGFLQINTNLFRTDGEANGTYVAWAVFQSIANLAFIILFLVVIISQLTGFGVDNYGIKKILPKLIITALLINLSYIICQLAIDIANIVGHGIEALFSTIQEEIVTNNVAAIKMDGDSSSHVVQAGLAGGVIITIVGAICVGAVLATNGAIIVPVLVTLLTIFISIIALLIILAVRQAMAVLLVVISPCAFVCYTLPNTKSLFSRWKKALSGLLLAYPICSAIIYGGEMVSTILLVANNNGGSGTSNFAIALSAAIISIAPIFLIPGIIKGSMGKISGTIANFGKGAAGHFGHRLRQGNFAQDMKRREMLGKAGIKLGKDGQIQETWRGKLQRPRSKAGQARLNARRAEALKEINSMNNGNTSYIGAAGMVNLQKGRNAYLANQKAQEVKDLESSIMAGNETVNGTKVDGNSISGLQNALQNAISSGDENSIRAYQNVLTRKGDNGREAVRQAMVNAIGANKASDRAKEIYSQNIMDNHASDYKNNNRSVYDFANKGQSGGIDASAPGSDKTLRMSDDIATGSLKGSQMSDMDDKAFERLEHQYTSGGSSDQFVYGAAKAALESEQAGNMKQQRRQSLENIVRNFTGTIPPPVTGSGSGSGGGTGGSGSGSGSGSGGGTGGSGGGTGAP